MAEELETGRRQIEASSRDASTANAELDQRRRQMETILESIPTGVLSLDASRRVTHANQALLRIFHPDSFAERERMLRGAYLADVFPPEVLQDLEPLLRRADRMGMTTSQMEMPLQRTSLNVAVTVANPAPSRRALGIRAGLRRSLRSFEGPEAGGLARGGAPRGA